MVLHTMSTKKASVTMFCLFCAGTGVGTGSTPLSDVWHANVTSPPIAWKRAAARLPHNLYGHAMAITDGTNIWLTGGRISTTALSTSIITSTLSAVAAGNNWTQITAATNVSAGTRIQSGQIPDLRVNHGMVAVGSVLWVIGGQGANGTVLPMDLYALDTTKFTLQWRIQDLASPLIPESRHSFGMTVIGSVIYVSLGFLQCFF
jgi:hypothetical protein